MDWGDYQSDLKELLNFRRSPVDNLQLWLTRVGLRRDREKQRKDGETRDHESSVRPEVECGEG